MSGYKIVKNKSPETFEIVEIENNLVLVRSKNYDKTKIVYEQLKKGSGFAGWTPPFFSLKKNAA